MRHNPAIEFCSSLGEGYGLSPLLAVRLLDQRKGKWRIEAQLQERNGKRPGRLDHFWNDGKSPLLDLMMPR
jgi:hypothetical protein